MSNEALSNRTINLSGDELRARIQHLLDGDNKLSQAHIGRQAGMSSSALNQWLRDRYRGDSGALESKLAIWLENYENRTSAAYRMPTTPGYIDTPTGERILAALGYAQLAEDIVLIYGSAGVSKTQSAMQYAATNPSVWIATMSPATKTVVPALEEVGEAMGIKPVGGAAKIQRQIIAKLRGSNGLLIIDEAQHLGVEALDAMRSLHDAAGVGLALIGNETVYTAMTGGNRAAYLDRLYSRIGKKIHIKRATTGDVDALIAAWNMRDKDCIDTARQIAYKPGGLRVLTKTLRLATMFARGDEKPLCCDHIRAAYRDLGDTSING